MMARHNLRLLLLALYVVLIMLAFQFACTYRGQACCGVKAGAITGHPMSIAEPPSVLLLFRAILTLNALPDPDLRYFAVGSTWPLYARRYLDAYNPDDETETTWRPTPHDVSAYLDVLAWARDLSKRGWQIMVLRARDYSLPLIADMLGSAITDIQHDHADAIHVVTTAANRDRNIWWSPLDNPPWMVSFPRRHHCA
jgi:uncharacterized protein DUF6362